MAITLVVGGHSGRNHGAAEPRVETGERVCRSMEWLDHATIEDRVEKPALERDQVQPSARAPRSSSPGATRWSRVRIEGLLETVQVVEDVRRAQELEESEAGVPREVHERDRVPADG